MTPVENSPKSLMLRFASKWGVRFKNSYPITWQRNLGQISRLRKSYSDEQIGRYIDHYLTDFVDDFAKKCGYSFGAFISLLPRVITTEQELREKRERAVTGSNEFERRQAALAALEADGEDGE